MSDLQGVRVVITGASSGFGEGFARHLASLGANLGLLARRGDMLQALAEELGTDRCEVLVADVSKSAEVKAALAQMAERFGGIDVLVNNAGLARPGLATGIRDSDLELQLAVNIQGLVIGCREAVPYLKEAANPRIVNVSSASAEHHDEVAGLSVYAASKAAVERFTRDLRREMQEQDIGVTMLRPGNAATQFAAGWDFNLLRDGLDLWHKRMGGHMDTGMEVAQVAEALAFCLSMPRGVSVDLLEIRPNRLTEKLKI